MIIIRISPFESDSDVISVTYVSFGDCVEVNSGKGIMLGTCFVVSVLRKIRDWYQSSEYRLCL